MSLADLQQEAAALSPEERRRLAAYIHSLDEEQEPTARSSDPLFHPRRLIDGASPGDVATRHDDYLYADAASDKPR